MMGTQFKVGDKVRRVQGGRHIDMKVGDEGTVESLVKGTENLIIREFQRPGWSHFVANFELVTPAPLDPSKVKAGDTVTVTQRTATVTDEVTLVSQGPHWHFDLKVYPSTVILGVPGVDDGLWTLTAHQPAPEPFPTAQHAVIRAKVANGDTRTLSLFWSYDRPEPERVWMDSLVVGGGSFSDADILAFEVLFPGTVAP